MPTSLSASRMQADLLDLGHDDLLISRVLVGGQLDLELGYGCSALTFPSQFGLAFNVGHRACSWVKKYGHHIIDMKLLEMSNLA